ncbi:hypothetical protein [Burkholderia ubonensis]
MKSSHYVEPIEIATEPECRRRRPAQKIAIAQENTGARRIGIGGRLPILRERQPGIQLAQAIPERQPERGQGGRIGPACVRAGYCHEEIKEL